MKVEKKPFITQKSLSDNLSWKKTKIGTNKLEKARTKMYEILSESLNRNLRNGSIVNDETIEILDNETKEKPSIIKK